MKKGSSKVKTTRKKGSSDSLTSSPEKTTRGGKGGYAKTLSVTKTLVSNQVKKARRLRAFSKAGQVALGYVAREWNKPIEKMVVKVDMLTDVDVEPIDAHVLPDLKECLAFSEAMRDFLSAMAMYYTERKSVAHYRQVKVALESPAFTRTYNWANTAHSPLAYVPAFVFIDITLMEVQDMLVAEKSDAIWSTLERQLSTQPDYDTTLTNVLDKLFSKFAKLPSQEAFDNAIHAMCLPVRDFHKPVDGARRAKGRPRAVARESSDTSDDGLSAMLAAAAEMSESQSPAKAKAAHNAPQGPPGKKLPQNIHDNLSAIGSIMFYENCTLESITKAQQLKKSPDCPVMIKAISGAPWFMSRYADSVAYTTAVERVKADYVKNHRHITLVKQVHDAFSKVVTVVHPDRPGESLISANKVINMIEVEPLVAALRALRQFHETCEKLHMEEDNQEELTNVLAMEPVILRQLLDAHATALLSAHRQHSTDWSGISADKYDTYMSSGGSLEGVMLTLDKLVDALVTFPSVEADPAQTRLIKEYAGWASSTLEQRTLHLRNTSKLDTIVKEGQAAYSRGMTYASLPSAKWAFLQNKTAAGSAKDADTLPAWAKRPLVQQKDYEWLMSFLESGNKLRQSKIVHRRPAAYLSYYESIGNNLVSATGAAFLDFARPFRPEPEHSKYAWVLLLSDKSRTSEIEETMRVKLMTLGSKGVTAEKEHEAVTMVEQDPSMMSEKKTAMMIGLNVSATQRQVANALLAFVSQENRDKSSLSAHFVKQYQLLKAMNKRLKAMRDLVDTTNVALLANATEKEYLKKTFCPHLAFYETCFKCSSAVEQALKDVANERLLLAAKAEVEGITDLYDKEWKAKCLPNTEGRQAFLDSEMKRSKKQRPTAEKLTVLHKKIGSAEKKAMYTVFESDAPLKLAEETDLDARSYIATGGAIAVSVYGFKKLGPAYSQEQLQKDGEGVTVSLKKFKDSVPPEILQEFVQVMRLPADIFGPLAKRARHDGDDGAGGEAASGSGEAASASGGAA